MSINAVTEAKSFSKKFGILTSPIIGIFTLINDVLLPIAPFGLYVSISLIIAAIVSLFTYPVVKKFSTIANMTWNESSEINLRKNSRHISLILILFGVFSSGAYIYGSNLTNNEGQPIGILSTKVPTVHKLQENLGLIEKELKVISETLSSVDQGVADIKNDTTALREDSTVMRRHSSTNIGMVYMSMTSGDIPALEEALKQGFNFNNIHNPLGAGTSNTYFTNVLGSNHATIDDVLEFLYINKQLDPSAKFKLRASLGTPSISSEIGSHMYTSEGLRSVVSIETNLLMEAALAGNTKAVEWFLSKGAKQRALKVNFDDGSVLKFHPEDYL